MMRWLQLLRAAVPGAIACAYRAGTYAAVPASYSIVPAITICACSASAQRLRMLQPTAGAVVRVRSLVISSRSGCGLSLALSIS